MTTTPFPSLSLKPVLLAAATALFAMSAAGATEPAPEAEEGDLSAFFVTPRLLPHSYFPERVWTPIAPESVPLSRVIGGNPNPPLLTGPDGVAREVSERIISAVYVDMRRIGQYPEDSMFVLWGHNTMEYARFRGGFGELRDFSPCILDLPHYQFKAPLRVGEYIDLERPFRYFVEMDCARHTHGTIVPPGHAYEFLDRVYLQRPVRRTAIDGAEYEAVPLVIERNEMPWKTYYLGYRMGLVAGKSDWQEANAEHPVFNSGVHLSFGTPIPDFPRWPLFPDARDDFELVKLPPPFEEGDIVEYVNAVDFSDPHYFYAARQSDLDLLDAIPEWQRTGLGFKQGGYLPVCRFYGNRAKGGPNTHFYSALDADCSMLRKDEQWLDEGHPFRASLPLPTGECPQATRPLHRAYNNGAHRGIDGNHRYTLDGEVLKAMTSKGWVYEGIVMCVPQ